MNWIELKDLSQVKEIKLISKDKKVVIFKHSTRCSISRLALSKFERNWNFDNVTPFLIDLLNHRDVSNQIAEVFMVDHESPQLLVIENEQCIEHASHNFISSIDLN